MAVLSVKTTYSLDVETVKTLEDMARRWKVSKSEALRRAIRSAAKQGPPEAEDVLKALDELQSSLNLSAEEAGRWEQSLRKERGASSRPLRSRSR